MKRTFTSLLLMVLFTLSVSAQDAFKPGGSGIGTVFFNYKYDLSKDVNNASSFNLERTYLGYKYDFSKTLSGRVVFDVAYNQNTKSFTAFAKNAYLDWAISPKLKLSTGMITLKRFDLQDKFWGYRYIIKPFIDEYGMGTSADLGANLEYTVNPMLSFNAFVVNGEGFKSIQDNFGLHRYGANAIVKPVEGLTLKVHYEMMPNKYQLADTLPIMDTATISGFSAFAGYEIKNKFRVGVEYNLMTNGTEYRKAAQDRNLGGISVYGAYMINPKFEVFGRYDLLQSNTLDNQTDAWNYSKNGSVIADGSLILAGVQYTPVKGVNMAVNYRNWLYKNSDMDAITGVYFNVGLNF